jgi:hypothetical protein
MDTGRARIRTAGENLKQIANSLPSGRRLERAIAEFSAFAER